VVVTNAAGSATSAVATLAVLVPPSLTTQPTNQIVVQGSNAPLSVVAAGTVPLGYQWRFNGTNVSGATTNAYAVTNAQSTNAGSYTVVVTNGAGAATSAVATLTVNIPPSFTMQPNSQTVTQGVNVALTAAATGTAPLSYQWRFKGTNIAGATTNSYTRNNVQVSDAGDYSVVVTNVAGSVTSSNATLTVIPLKPLKFDLVGLLPDSRVRLVLSGEPGNYAVERVTNLGYWAWFTNLTISDDPAELIDEPVTNNVRRFYRALSAP